MVGYVAGPRIGSYCYNAAHTYVAPLALAAVGLWASVPVAVPVAAVWPAHIGVDRPVGYGLKYPTGFGDTHLSTGPETGNDTDREFGPVTTRRPRR